MSSLQAQEAHWFTDFEAAKEEAKSSNKTILMYFTGSDWCAPCKMLKKDFWENPEFFIPFRVDIVSEDQLKANKSLQAKYNKDKSFPTLVALTNKGKAIAEISAYSQLRDPSNYFAFLDKVR